MDDLDKMMLGRSVPLKHHIADQARIVEAMVAATADVILGPQAVMPARRTVETATGRILDKQFPERGEHEEILGLLFHFSVVIDFHPREGDDWKAREMLGSISVLYRPRNTAWFMESWRLGVEVDAPEDEQDFLEDAPREYTYSNGLDRRTDPENPAGPNARAPDPEWAMISNSDSSWKFELSPFIASGVERFFAIGAPKPGPGDMPLPGIHIRPGLVPVDRVWIHARPQGGSCGYDLEVVNVTPEY